MPLIGACSDVLHAVDLPAILGHPRQPLVLRDLTHAEVGLELLYMSTELL